MTWIYQKQQQIIKNSTKIVKKLTKSLKINNVIVNAQNSMGLAKLRWFSIVQEFIFKVLILFISTLINNTNSSGKSSFVTRITKRFDFENLNL